MRLELGQFSDDDLAHLARVYNYLAGRDDLGHRWQAWGREVAEALHLELADRLITHGWDTDPMAMAWYGRLPRPDEPGKWERDP